VIGYTPAEQAIRASLDQPPATGADNPDTSHDRTCWADPLSRAERRNLANRLARACGTFYRARTEYPDDLEKMLGCVSASIDMSDLYTDVTERAVLA
jgi:hypothetical protein